MEGSHPIDRRLTVEINTAPRPIRRLALSPSDGSYRAASGRGLIAPGGAGSREPDAPL